MSSSGIVSKRATSRRVIWFEDYLRPGRRDNLRALLTVLSAANVEVLEATSLSQLQSHLLAFGAASVSGLMVDIMVALPDDENSLAPLGIGSVRVQSFDVGRCIVEYLERCTATDASTVHLAKFRSHPLLILSSLDVHLAEWQIALTSNKQFVTSIYKGQNDAPTQLRNWIESLPPLGNAPAVNG